MLSSLFSPQPNMDLTQNTLQQSDLQDVVTESNKLRKLWRLMADDQRAYLGATASLGVAAGANTATFLLIRYFIDDYLGGATGVAPLAIILAGFVTLAVVQAFFTFQSRKLAAQTAEGVALRLRNYLYDHLQRLPFRYHDKMQTGELLQRATSDIDAIRRFFADQAIESGRVLLLFVVNFVAICSLSWQLALYSVIAIPIVLVISIFFFRMVEKRYEAYQNQEALLSTTVQENLSGVRVVKAFARQEYEADKFDKINWQKYVLGRRLLLTHATYWPVTDIICGAQMLTGFAIAARMTINGHLTIGEYLAYAGLVIWIIWPMRNLGRLIVQMSTGLVSLGRVSEVIKAEREPVSANDITSEKRLRGELIFSHVGLRYNEGEELVLQDISFHAKPGQRIALLGPTGSGKTTTLAAMVDHINTHREVHVVTIEDPIEVVHEDKIAMINQREVHVDTGSFANAMRAAMRQDPDVILVGEMRDMETVRAAISAAETGHFVMSTLHTVDSEETISRIIDFFPPHEQRQVRLSLAGALRGILCQRLVPKADGQGRAVAMEICINTGRVAEAISDAEKTSMIGQLVAEGGYYGMQTFDQHLTRLFADGSVTLDAALASSSNPHDLVVELRRLGLVQ